tara:strand:- start:482 stop:1108 length:627 start_codon:yes stop_codon:yes gene_type:complete
MRILVTGHTKGIGKAIWNHYRFLHGTTCLGVSRSNDYPLNKISEWFEENEYDVFVNNAFDHQDIWAQTNALLHVYDRWRFEPEKIIINIGSMSTDPRYLLIGPYTVAKQALESACDQLHYLSLTKNGPRVTNIAPGYVDTPLVEGIVDRHKLTPDNIVSVVEFVLSFPGRIKYIPVEPFYFQTMLYNKDYPNKDLRSTGGHGYENTYI